MNDPEVIRPEMAPQEEVITVYIKGKKHLVSPAEAVSIINQISGVLLAYEYTGGRGESQKKYSIGIPAQRGVSLRPEP